MPRIKYGLVKIIAKELGVSMKTVRRRVKAKREESANLYHPTICAFAYAQEQGLDLTHMMTEDELLKVKELIGAGLKIVKEDRKTTQPKQVRPRVIRMPSFPDLKCPNLPANITTDAKNMTEVYYYLYLFENSIRYFIIDTLSKYGPDWWGKKVSEAVQRNAQRNIDQEEKQKWHGKRGQHPIFYTFISDLSSIISVNWEDFKDKLPSQEWLNQRIKEIELSRNTIAHNNPLKKDDFERVKMYFRDWIKLISSS